MRTKAMPLIAAFIISAVLYALPAFADVGTFYITLYNISGQPSEDGGVYFSKSNGGYLDYYDGENLNITYDGAGYTVNYDTIIMPPGEYLMTTTCSDQDWDTYSYIFKKINLPGSSFSMSCSGSDTDMPRFKLELRYDNGSLARNYPSGRWSADNTQLPREIESFSSWKNPATVTLNKGFHDVYVSDSKLPSPQRINVDGTDPIVITFPTPSASVRVEVKENEVPVPYGLVALKLAGNNADYINGWTNVNGVFEKNNYFIPETYIIQACCPPNQNAGWCLEGYEDSKFVSQTVTLEENEVEIVPMECSSSNFKNISVRTEEYNGVGIYNRGWISYCYDPQCSSKNDYFADFGTGMDGDGLVELSYGTYLFTTGYKTITMDRIVTVSDTSPPGPVVFTYPEPNGSVTIKVADGNGNPITNNSYPVLASIYIDGIGGGSTDYKGEFTSTGYYGDYGVGVNCMRVGGSSFYQGKSFTLSEANPDVALEFKCFESQIVATVVEEYEPGKTRTLNLTPAQLNSFKVTLLDKRGGEVTSIWPPRNPVVINVTAGNYTMGVDVTYTAYPQPTYSYLCWKDEKTGLCNQIYSYTYDVKTDAGRTAYVTIPFRTWVFTALNQSPIANPFPPGIIFTYPMEIEMASDFSPSLAFIIISIIVLSFCLAFIQRKNIKPENK